MVEPHCLPYHGDIFVGSKSTPQFAFQPLTVAAMAALILLAYLGAQGKV